jgi:hypothetical protein
MMKQQRISEDNDGRRWDDAGYYTPLQTMRLCLLGNKGIETNRRVIHLQQKRELQCDAAIAVIIIVLFFPKPSY